MGKRWNSSAKQQSHSDDSRRNIGNQKLCSSRSWNVHVDGDKQCWVRQRVNQRHITRYIKFALDDDTVLGNRGYLEKPVFELVVIPPSSPPDVFIAAGDDAEVSQGGSLRIIATTRGLPAPRVRWRLASGRTLQTGQSFNRFQVFENGTLLIRNVQVSDRGRYRVRAANVAGRARRSSTVRVVGKRLEIAICPHD